MANSGKIADALSVSYQDFYNKLERKYLAIQVPSFEINKDNELKNEFIDMGYGSIYDNNYKKITEYDIQNLYFGQKATFKLNEEGIKACPKKFK